MKNLKISSLLLGGLLALAAVGCNTTLTLDDQALEGKISQDYEAQIGVGLTTVDCPSDRPLQQGDTFTCSATTEQGENLVITVTQTDSAGTVHWQVTG
jgi:hypothetical protein